MTEHHRGKKLTHTNTDLFCADTTSNIIVRVIKLGIYRFNLWTGLYMLNESERWAFHIFGWMCTAAFLVFSYTFVMGFLDGVQGNSSKVMESMAKNAAKMVMQLNATTSAPTVDDANQMLDAPPDL